MTKTMTENDAQATILIVDDEPENLKTLRIHFEESYDVIAASSGKESVRAVSENNDISAIIMDIKMADMDGIEAARAIRQISPEIPIIFHTGYPGDYDEKEIDIGEKPFDYVEKLESFTKLNRAVRNAVEYRALKRSSLPLSEYAEASFGMVGKSEAMQQVFRIMRKIASADTNALLIGESGTGKETAARAIHENSGRREGKFITFNCRGADSELAESDLFGYNKGALSGAIGDHPGPLEEAGGGTVFLDAVDRLSLEAQARLLELLETGRFRRVGDSSLKRQTDVRILAAAQEDLEKPMSEGLFMEDLYYRLTGVIINMPPLRDRREDIPILAEKIKIRLLARQNLPEKIFDPQAIQVLNDYDWPGNIRQLEATIENLLTLAESDIIMAEDVTGALKLDKSEKEYAGSGLSLAEQVRSFEKSRIIETLNRNDFNISASARELKIDRSNLRKKIKYYKISLP